MKHKHHIIPRHMGGQDSAGNLVELTVEEHAEAHRILFEEHGRWQDELAWKGLSGQIGNEEVTRLAISRANKGKVISEEHKRRISEGKKGKKFTEAHKQALREAQLKSPNHPTRGKKRPEHSATMSGFKYRKEPCSRCGKQVGINMLRRHESICTH